MVGTKANTEALCTRRLLLSRSCYLAPLLPGLDPLCCPLLPKDSSVHSSLSASQGS